MAEAKVRLLICLKCKSLEELPDYEGPVENDHLLEHLASEHARRHPHAMNSGNLVKVPAAAWDLPETRAQIQDEIRKAIGGGETGLGSAFYEARNTFLEDAMTCFAAHQRNPACSDYKDDSKALGVTEDIKQTWKDAGIKRTKYVDRAQRRFLCEFCPVHSLVQQAARRKAGLDK
jgi:hypothetical protein